MRIVRSQIKDIQRQDAKAQSHKENPKGISSFSPALPDEGGLRWVTNQNEINPGGVESMHGENVMQPFQGWKYFGRLTQGSSFLATLG